MNFTQELHEWHEFYILVGTAGATLLALLFVAASLGSGILTSKSKTSTRMYMSPVVFHFAAVFIISALCLMPKWSAPAFTTVIGVLGLSGLLASAGISVWLLAGFTKDPFDRMAYGVWPMFGYGGVFAAAMAVPTAWEWSLHLLAGSLLLLIGVNIRNVWDLTLAMVRGHGRDRR